MRIKAHAKINWSLDITGVRPDGYHLLDMLVQRLELHDEIALELQPDISLDLANNSAAPQGAANLAHRAATLLKEHSSYPGGALIRLKKNIPSQAGLGGGSADAAAVLIGLNSLWGLNKSPSELARIGILLGADVPLCLHQGINRVQGIGETIAFLGPGQVHHLVLLQGEAGLSTKTVFSHFMREQQVERTDVPALKLALDKKDYGHLKGLAQNHLEGAAASLQGQVLEMKADLYRHGAAFAQMSGAGSVVFGVFDNKKAALMALVALKPLWQFSCYTRTLAGQAAADQDQLWF